MGVPPHLHIGLGLGPNLHIGSQSADWEVSPVVSVPQNHTTKLLLPLSKLHLGGRQCLASSSSSAGSRLACTAATRPHASLARQAAMRVAAAARPESNACSHPKVWRVSPSQPENQGLDTP